VRARDATGCAGRGGAQETVKDERGIVGRYTGTGGTRRRARGTTMGGARMAFCGQSSMCLYAVMCIDSPLPPPPAGGGPATPVLLLMFMPHGIVSSIPSYAR